MASPSTVEIVTTSSPAELFAVIADRVAQVFSFSTRERLAQFATTHAAGGHRAALVPGDVPMLVTADWNTDGIAAWDARTGAQLWHRKDLNRTQHLAHLGGEPGRQVLGTAREDGLGWALNAQNGKQIASLRTIRQLYGAPERSRFVTVERTVLSFRDASTWNALAAPPLFKSAGSSLVLLDAAVSADQVVISRPGGDFGEARVEAFAHAGGKRWNFAPAAGAHITRIVPAHDGGFAALEVSTRSGTQSLVRMDANGALRDRRPIDADVAALFDGGRYLIRTSGAVIDAATLAPVWSFAT